MNNKGSQNVATCKPVTTFVQTDTNTFREIVQRLTGPSENNSAVAPPEATVIKTVIQKKPTSKLHERRQCMRPKLEIVKPPLSFKPTGTTPSSKSGNTNLLTSPVGTPSSLFSNLSLVEGEPDSCTTNIEEEGKAIKEEEEKAIKERRFYLHPSPRSKPGYTEPELLPLFPLTSPNSSGKP
ncbi:PREDICTED: VQ motif-containing protein 31-like isoform X1 [Camelina sativa]|uniref:VQ motif-containing protein 31-like isoform X1 n=1 Tax=Camelina sativa TaxID=90675 RepID=A0ABM0V997_CAMSA|nr:PREDICTED: VQ motif-containing protein 31-like isoform X1 [Camelina sativa]